MKSWIKVGRAKWVNMNLVESVKVGEDGMRLVVNDGWFLVEKEYVQDVQSWLAINRFEKDVPK
jgi:hypothetical protein